MVTWGFRARTAWIAGLVAAFPLARPCAAQAPAPAPAPEAPPAPTVTLVQAGEAPRQLLRLAPRSGRSQAFDVTMRMEAGRTINGEESPTPAIPGMKFSFATVVSEISPAREISYDVECAGADVLDTPGADPAMLEQAREGVQLMVGLRGRGRLSDRGVSQGATLKVPADFDPDALPGVKMLERLLDQPVPLPEEPVGPGGQWQARISLDQQGIRITQTTVYTLAAFDGTSLQIDLKITQEAVPPEPAAGDVLRLVSYASHGSGHIGLRLDQAFPRQAATDVVNESTWVMDQAGQKQQMIQRTRMIAEIAAR